MQITLSMKLSLGTILWFLIATTSVAQADLSLSGKVTYRGSYLSGVSVTASWRGKTDQEVTAATDSQGRFQKTLSSFDLADSRSITLSFHKPGYALAEFVILVRDTASAQSISIGLSRLGLTGTETEFQTLANKRSQTERTIFFIPYVLSSGTSRQEIDRLNEQMPHHIKYRVLATLNSVYRKPISVEKIDTAISASNTEKIRRLGAFLRALAIVSGRGELERKSGGPAIFKLVSEYVLPASASEHLPSHSYVLDDIPNDKLTNPVFGQHLNENWVHRTLLALADKEFRALGAGDNPKRIVAFLTAAKSRLSTEAALSEIDQMISRILEARP